MKVRNKKVKKIIIHASETQKNIDVSMGEIRKWHTSEPRKWSDIGYHFVIRLDGTIERGRDILFEGAHAKGHNHDSIGICYVGGVDLKGNKTDTRTKEQKFSLESLIINLKITYGNLQVIGHKDVTDKKDCPFFDAKGEYEYLSNKALNELSLVG